MKNEIKILPNNQRISVNGNKVLRNKGIINKSTHNKSEIKKYSWDEALQQNIFPRSGITFRNVKGIFIDKLGITPSDVYIERSSVSNYPSIYVKANYHGETILYSRRETASRQAGQTILYSKYAKEQCSGWGTDPHITKENILQWLKIPVDLAEIMILPNNKATMDQFEMNETEEAPVIAPPKPGTKPKQTPKREKLGNPMVQPRPKAKMSEGGEENIVNKIAQRFKKLKHA